MTEAKIRKHLDDIDRVEEEIKKNADKLLDGFELKNVSYKGEITRDVLLDAFGFKDEGEMRFTIGLALLLRKQQARWSITYGLKNLMESFRLGQKLGKELNNVS